MFIPFVFMVCSLYPAINVGRKSLMASNSQKQIFFSYRRHDIGNEGVSVDSRVVIVGIQGF